MSIIENLRGVAKAATPTIKASDIGKRLQAAQSQVTALEAHHGELALEAVAGVEGAQVRLDALQVDLAKIRSDVKTLEVALAAAHERDEAAVRRARAQLQKTQLAAVHQHLKARDAAADALSIALGEAAKQWQILAGRSAKAENANPVGGAWPNGAATSAPELERLVVLELARQAACADVEAEQGLRTAEGFPGAAFVEDARSIQPLPEAIKNASTHIVKILTGRVAG